MKCLIIARVIISFMLTFSLFHGQSKGEMSLPGSIAESGCKQIDLEHFSFCLPPEITPRKAKGIDSAIWKYASDGLELTIDLGLYSGKPSNLKKELEYREERMRIGGKKAVMVFFRSDDASDVKLPYVSAVYFANIGLRKNKLFLYATCASRHKQDIARKIFLSLEFK